MIGSRSMYIRIEVMNGKVPARASMITREAQTTKKDDMTRNS